MQTPVEMESTPDMVSRVYQRMEENVAVYRSLTGRPLTLSEKIISGHLAEAPQDVLEGYISLKPDRVALQDVTGQMVMLQFMSAGVDRTTLPTTIHCDHLIRAVSGGGTDIQTSLNENNEVFTFLESAAARYGCGFWRPGAGIIHQVVLENYAFPGGLMIGTDSHTPNAGGLGMIAVGVGGVDAAEVMAGLPWEILNPKRIGVRLVGEMNGWTSPKDVILKVASLLSVSGGTNAILEYFGPGTKSISCTGKATITNMGAEIGATCSIFPYDSRMETYLRHTGRSGVADLANRHDHILTADPEIEENPDPYFDRVLEIDLSSLEPHIVGPHTPDLARPISQMGTDAEANEYVDDISVALIGSCTNSSYEDMSRTADLASQAKARGIKTKVPLLVTPGSELIRATIERDGQMAILEDIGATVLANACGPCIGQWSRPELESGRRNTIVTSFNRNFPGRNDGHRSTMNFIASPEIVVALALGGRLSFDPTSDALVGEDGDRFTLKPPAAAPEVPDNGFVRPKGIYTPPPDEPGDVIISPKSRRLQRLEPFAPWNRKDMTSLRIMVKAKGKCTTDQISPAGAWLSFRGHLENLSENMLLGAVNAFGGHVGQGRNATNGRVESFPEIAKKYKENGIRWAIIGDENYGEGSSREHAAMTPRYLNCAAVISRSFARIHETNLKKQGILALTFQDSFDYDRIREDDTIDILGLKEMTPGKPLECMLEHTRGGSERVYLEHSYSDTQIRWFQAGSALNTLGQAK